MEWYIKVMKENYANFNGRARRNEYWMFVLIQTIIMCILWFLDSMLGTGFSIDSGYGQPVSLGYGYLYMIGALVHFVPALAVLIRRLHDVGKSGHFYSTAILLTFVFFIGAIWLLVVLVSEGENKENRFGPDPKST
mgnify:CR=1 FL=1